MSDPAGPTHPNAAVGLATGRFRPDTGEWTEVDEAMAAVLERPEAPAWTTALVRLGRHVLETRQEASRAVPEATGDRRSWVVWVRPSAHPGDVEVATLPLPPSAAADVVAAHARSSRAQRLESIGQFASAVAHDFNNLLAAIRVTAHTLGHEIEDPRKREDCRRIVEATERAARLTQGLLHFAGRSGGPRTRVDVAALLRDLATILPSMVGEGIDLDLSVPEESRWIVAARTQVEQVVMNLVLNAREAMPRGGRLRIGIEALTATTDCEELGWDLPAGAYFVLFVEDEGPGIPPEHRQVVFEPYYSTKTHDGQRGLGLGLATVYGVARSLGGDVRIDEGGKGGARVEVALPQAEAGADVVAAKVASPRRRGGTAVLVVDDDALVRRTTAHFIEALGYRVYEAESGIGALSVVASHKDELEAVLLDMIMPGMNGRSTCRAIRRMAPRVRVLIMSGCTTPGDTEAALADGAECFLAKPFDLDDLAARLGRVNGSDDGT